MDIEIHDHLAQTQYALDEAAAGKLSQIFAALADPVRLHILAIVSANGTVCSCNLEKPTGKSQPTISHHTKVLAEAGLIKAEKRGRWVWWSMDSETVNFFYQAAGRLLPHAHRLSDHGSGNPENIC